MTFLAVLVVVLVISFAPAVTRGNATVRLSAVSAPSVISHVYVGVAGIQLHRVGLPLDNSSWTVVSSSSSSIDLVSEGTKTLPPTLASASVSSGRYDEIRVSFTNSTVVIGSLTRGLSSPPSIVTNTTLTVPPNGIGNVLLVVDFDYTTLLTNQPSLSLILIGVFTV